MLANSSGLVNFKMLKVNPNRKSFDYVQIIVSDNESITIEKPGSGVNVFEKVRQEEGFYVPQGGINKICELHKGIKGIDWISGMKLVKRRSDFKIVTTTQPKPAELEDLKFMKLFCRKIKENAKRKVQHEFLNLKKTRMKYPLKDDSQIDL